MLAGTTVSWELAEAFHPKYPFIRGQIHRRPEPSASMGAPVRDDGTNRPILLLRDHADFDAAILGVGFFRVAIDGGTVGAIAVREE
jgi:hypothetical protein